MGEHAAPYVTAAALDGFATELAKLAKKPDEARAFIDKADMEKRLEFHRMTKAKDIFGLVDDPDLKGLPDATVFEPRGGQFATTTKKKEKVVLDTHGTYEPIRYSSFGGAVRNDKDPMFDFWKRTPERFVFWRAEDYDEHELKSFAEARDKVLAAWKFDEARRLAREAATDLKARIEEKLKGVSPGSYDSETEAILRDAKLGDPFTLRGVAKLVSSPSVNPGVEMSYSPYRIPETTIKYQPAGLVDKLLGADLGKGVVFEDKPFTKVFLAIETAHDVPQIEGGEFKDAFANAKTDRKDDLWKKYFLPEHRGKFEDRVLRQLREEASPANVDEKTGLIKVDVHATEEPQ
jgi:hypothetical protein